MSSSAPSATSGIERPIPSQCCVCLQPVAGQVEQGVARSNVRRFATERFALWRCPRCRSVHARDDVDLGAYYRAYPFHPGTALQWPERAMYRNLRRRLERAGLRRGQQVLDFGCGSGALVRYLRQAGYPGAEGYDEFSPEFQRPERLARRYHAVVSQDVIEHVDDPLALLRTFDGLVEPGGLIGIGTPNGAALDLQDTEPSVHGLHQPYHRHILSSEALRAAGEQLGWRVVGHHPTEYANTRLPFVNVRFVLHAMRCYDDTLDAAFELPAADPRPLRNFGTLWYGLFGSFCARDTGVMYVFRKSA